MREILKGHRACERVAMIGLILLSWGVMSGPTWEELEVPSSGKVLRKVEHSTLLSQVR